MEEIKLVSVIIPTFKSARYLYECLYSIVNQTYRNLEIIILDDTPYDDGTEEIIRSFDDNRIRYVKPAERLGMVKSLNYGVGIAKGQYIARMDADDISHLDRIKKQLEFLEANPEIGVVGCNCYVIDDGDHVTGAIIHPCDDSDIKIKMMFNVGFVHPSVIIRKDLLVENPYNEECFCCEDYELWSRIMKKTKFHNIKQKLFKYRVLSSSAMQSQLKRLMEDDEYYIKHISILKKAYDNVLRYFDVGSMELHESYVDLTFAKRINQFSIEERFMFLDNYRNIISRKFRTEFITPCITYQWIKMTKNNFWRIKDISVILNCIVLILQYAKNKINAVVKGVLSINENKYLWKI